MTRPKHTIQPIEKPASPPVDTLRATDTTALPAVSRQAATAAPAVTADPAATAGPAGATDLTEPRRGAKRRYLSDRALTPQERYQIRKARRKGLMPPALPLQTLYTLEEVQQREALAYQRGFQDGLNALE